MKIFWMILTAVCLAGAVSAGIVAVLNGDWRIANVAARFLILAGVSGLFLARRLNRAAKEPQQ